MTNMEMVDFMEYCDSKIVLYEKRSSECFLSRGPLSHEGFYWLDLAAGMREALEKFQDLVS